MDSQSEKERVQLAFVGGLLGAGKTSLLRSAALHLTALGKKVALITNDQTGELVDTIILQRSGLAVEEVAGSCFCCDFNGLTESILSLLRNEEPDIILAEPVGSCTDLQATVMRPMRDLMGAAVDLLPLTVLVDPERLREMEDIGGNDAGGLSMDYLFRQQMEEAEILLLSKADQQNGMSGLKERLEQEYNHARVGMISARTGEGIEHWWTGLQRACEPGTVLQHIDYDRYAAAEAAMGWLNARLRVNLPVQARTTVALRALLEAVAADVSTRAGRIGNLKAILSDEEGWLRGGIVRAGQEPDIEDGGFSGPAGDFTLNIRATLPAQDLHDIVLDRVQNWFAEVVHVDYLHPAAPNPTYRYA